MNIEIATKVEQDYQSVWRGFDEKLFLALKPPLVPFKLLRFDGCEVGDKVQISVAGQAWHANIVEQKSTKDEIYFVDVGEKMPFPLKTWRHKHRILRNADDTSTIIDDIEYSTGNRLLDKLMRPVVYQQFAARQPIYRDYFKNR